MSTVTPPSSTPTPAPLPPPKVILVTAPPSLATLPPDAKLDVSVNQVLDTGLLKLSSKLGDIVVRWPNRPALKIGEPLILHLIGGGGGTATKLQITSPDGRTLLTPSPLQQLQSGGNAQPSPQSVISVPQVPKLLSGITVTATLLRPLALDQQFQVLKPTPRVSGGQAAPGTTQTAPGTAGPALSGTGNVPSAPTGQAATPSAPTAGNISTPQPGTQQGQIFPAGSSMTIKVVSLQPPQGPSPALTPPPATGTVALKAGAIMAATVSGSQGTNAAVAQTHAGPISLPTAQPLPPGTQITFEIVSLKMPVEVSDTQHARLTGAVRTLFGEAWHTLDDAMETLRDVAPGAHAQVLQAAMPRADAQLTANVLFFIAAIRGGDLKGWMGDGPLRILDRHRPDLAGRLRDDVGQMSRSVDDQQSGEWRMFAVPFLQGGDIERIRMLIRERNEDDGEDDPNEGGKRFVVDLNLSRLGHLQIDGLVGEKGKRLDVVVRSETPFTAKMRQDIRALYDNAVAVTGLEGSVGFQSAPANFIPLTLRAEETPDEGDVVI